MENIKGKLDSLIAAILAVDINPGYKATDVDYNKLKVAKQEAMSLKALITADAIFGGEMVAEVTPPLLRGYRIADVNVAIAHYNAVQSQYHVRPVKAGDKKMLSGEKGSVEAPRSWTTNGLEKFREFGLRRPEEDDYQPLKNLLQQ